jgi:endo-1,4-beta-mannosidase
MPATREDVKQVATRINDRLVKKQTDEREWPDCLTVTQQIGNTLESEYGFSESEYTTKSLYLSGEYLHHVLKVWLRKGDWAVVDASFKQFAGETETPFDVGPMEDVPDVVVVSPPEKYVFWDG